MIDISTGQETKTKARFCPNCGSPSVEAGMVLLVEGSVTPYDCKACGWHGGEGALLNIPFSHELGSDENILVHLMGDLRTVLAKHCAIPLGGFLLKWGFLERALNGGHIVLNPKQLSRYMTAISKAVLTAVIEERQQQEKEKNV